MNKRLPGAYINVKGLRSNIMAQAGERGTVFTIFSDLNWGEDGVVEVTLDSDFRSLFGKELTDAKLVGLRLILNNAHKAIIYNVNPGSKASAESTVLPWYLTAKYNGDIGNDIKVTVSPDPNSALKWTVTTIYGTQVVDTQTITKASELKANGYVELSIKNEAKTDDGVAMLQALTSPITVPMTGGTSTPTADTITKIQQAIETNDFETMVVASAPDTSEIHAVIATAAKRLREQQGRKVQAVVPVDAGIEADYEGIIVVGNAIVLDDDTQLTQSQTAGFVAGATAAAQPNESLTYRVIPGAKDVVPRFTDEQAIEEVNKGHLIMIAQRDQVKVLQDINSLHTFTETKPYDFSKNRPLRVLDDIANTVRKTWEDSFIGQVTNNATGRDLFKGTLAEYLTSLQSSSAIQDFKMEDISVLPGQDKDTVVVTLAVTPTDAMEKLYMEVTSR